MSPNAETEESSGLALSLGISMVGGKAHEVSSLRKKEELEPESWPSEISFAIL